MNANNMQEIRIPPPELIIQLLEKARSSLNEAAREGAEQSEWSDYRKAEILYATALFHVLRNQLPDAHSFAKEAEQQAQHLKRKMVDRMNPTKESTSTQLERCSTRMQQLRESFGNEKAKLSPSRLSHCKKALSAARERFDIALGAFVTSDFSRAEKSLIATKTQLDTVERLLHQRYENDDGGYGVRLDDLH
ncbi:MAG: hypothetical protein NTZ35_11930 [Ignavibacteriales bacterium]|nr:hypothetical protein [Ignavibacteriales bacterium]